MARNLWGTFFADRVDHAELRHLIPRYFTSGTQPRSREIVYPGDREGEFAVKLVFNKKDQLCALEAGPLLTPALETTIRHAIASSLLNRTGQRVHRHVLFAHHKLSGSWSYKNLFQVLPVPNGAPRIDAVFGDHPFILEVMISASTDSSITGMRAQGALEEAELLLAGLVNNSIHSLCVQPSYGHWVQLPGTTTSTYLQAHYDLGSFFGDHAAFSPPGALAPVILPQDLFGPNSLHAGQPLSFPDGLSEILSAYEALPPHRREQFLRACHWVQLANRLFLQSFSAAYMAIITATEVLFLERKREICQSCRQPQYRLRHQFATFLETHVPLSYLTSSRYQDIRSFADRLRDVYDTRSTITHGSALRGWESPTSGFTPQTNSDDSDLRTLLRIMHFALGAWLWQATHTRNTSSGCSE